MGKFKRIQVNDIKAMQKTLDDLPDKNLGKTREEAAEMLNAQIMKALEKGYTVRELAEVMSRGNVAIPAPVIRAKIMGKQEPARAEPKAKAAKTEKQQKPVAPQSTNTNKPQDVPDWFTSDTPDSEL